MALRHVRWFILVAVETNPQSPRNRSKRWLAVAFFLLVLIWGLSWLAARMLIVDAPLEHADVIVVLSGS
ncbi:MAG TPA: hypothetical protein DHU55_09750, partial [Blastocatellia bacterium]|nr:hypothetical protein [Blastocatellia bacterium]